MDSIEETLGFGLSAISADLLSEARLQGYAGYDPFDSLNSRLLRSTPLYRSAWLRLLWLQLGKRSPINLRPLLWVPRARNPKAIALFISGLLEDFRRTGDESFLHEAKNLGGWLVANRATSEWSQHPCWGYPFDWQARAFHVPAGKPNIITTCYVARALYDLGVETRDEEIVASAIESARFISNELYCSLGGDSFYAYIPGETTFVYNASLWGSAWVAFAGKILADEELVSESLEVARHSADAQAPDGSWVYGTRSHHQFIDGFHTGYNLEALCSVRDSLGTKEFDDCIKRGYDYYVKTLLDDSGSAKYYDKCLYPLDMHSFSQAMLTLLKVGGTAEDLHLCRKVVGRAVELMYMPSKGRFMYQRSRLFSNRVNYLRWTQAWAYYALAFYNRYSVEHQHAEN